VSVFFTNEVIFVSQNILNELIEQETLPSEIVRVNSTTLSVMPGALLNYKCNDSSMTFNTSKQLSLQCGADGNFVAPATWPTCRAGTTKIFYALLICHCHRGGGNEFMTTVP
jgi:hypothetical protein